MSGMKLITSFVSGQWIKTTHLAVRVVYADEVAVRNIKTVQIQGSNPAPCPRKIGENWAKLLHANIARREGRAAPFEGHTLVAKAT